MGADTIVLINGEVLGKPRTPEEAKEMLRTLSGRIHTVYHGLYGHQKERIMYHQRCR